jgi:hypothetical protein
MMWLVAAAAVIVIGVALSLTGSADILRRHTQRGNNMTQNNPLL